MTTDKDIQLEFIKAKLMKSGKVGVNKPDE